MRPILFAIAWAAVGCASAEPASPPRDPPPVAQVPENSPPPESPSPVSDIPSPPADSSPPAPVTPEGDPVDRAVAEFRAFLKTDPVAEDLIARIDALALLKDPHVAKVLVRVFHDPKWNDSVRAAACRASGSQGDKKVGIGLVMFADDKDVAAKPALMAAALEGAGKADPFGCNKELLNFGKKYMDRDAQVSIAAFRAAAGAPTSDTVQHLVQGLARAEHVSAEAPAEKKANRALVRPVLVELLQGTTGKTFPDAQSWTAWWKAHRNSWRPAAR